MAKLFERVNPGDLITSGYLNSILDTIEALDVRIAQLETVKPVDNRVVIDSLNPASGPYRLGQKLTIIGKNFEYFIGGLRVRFGGVEVIDFIEASDTKLVFNIPNTIPNVVEAGTDVILIVSNRSSSETRVIKLKPKQVPLTGVVQVIYMSVNPITVPAGQNVDFLYLLKSSITIPATFDISPIISDNTTSGWQTQVLDSNKTPIPANQIPMGTNEEKLFYIRVSVPTFPVGANKVFKLKVTATAGIVSYSDLRTFTSGQQPEQQDESFMLAITGADPSNILSATTISLPPGGEGYIDLTASKFTNIGRYDISLSLGAGTTDWTATFQDTGTPDHYDVKDTDISQARFPVFKITAGSNPSNKGEVKFSMQRSGETKKRSITFILTRI